MNVLRSHNIPSLLLCQHLDQMRLAARGIWNRHSLSLRERCGDIWGWVEDSISFHDTGKGTIYFQTFIADPDHYSGNKLLKSHTPLSMLCVLAHGREHGWAWTRQIAVAAIAAGHHSELKTKDELNNVFGSETMMTVLEHQLSTLDWDAIDLAVGLRLTRIRPADGLDIASEADDHLEALFDQLRSDPDRLSFRLRCQLAFSVLLEADKAFLAIDPADVARYLNPSPIDLPARIVVDFLAGKRSTAVNPLRVEARAAFLKGLALTNDARIQTMTLPTGIGKTLLGASWVLAHRQRLSLGGSPPPKILVVLPFLSIVDQTVKEYRDLLSSEVNAGDLISYHSLSERIFDPELKSKSQEFFLDTWQSDVVITTFDQLLLALFSPKTKHQLRFHNLADALIVLDEVQSIPCVLWEPLRQALTGLVELGSTHVLAMSATQPGFLTEALELISNPAPRSFFSQMKRYRLVLRHRAPMSLSEFIAECRTRLREWKGRRVLLTLNTRRSARKVFEELRKPACRIKLPMFFITGDRTPRDRLAAIDEIKKGEPCLVVSTQCVEAGVDIDMDHVIRDFSPLDSLIQIAGRCNRNGNSSRGTVEIVLLRDDQTHCKFSGMIYSDKILLQATSEVLRELETIDEEHVYDLTLRYFEILRREKNLGADVVESWINWEETQSVRSLFRGDQRPQLSFVVVDQDPEIPQFLESARAIPDRWERKRAFRALAPRIAAITVSITVAEKKLDPSDFGNPFPSEVEPEDAWFWLVKPGIYDSDCGLDFQIGSDQEPTWGIVFPGLRTARGHPPLTYSAGPWATSSATIRCFTSTAKPVSSIVIPSSSIVGTGRMP